MTSADETYPLLHTGRRHIWLLILVYLLLGVIYSFATPVFEASDEIWHYPVVREIRNSINCLCKHPGKKPIGRRKEASRRSITRWLHC